MVEVFGRVEGSTTQNGTLITTFRIPALSETLARRRAMANGRLKGLKSAEVKSSKVVGESSFPNASLYEVVVESSR